MKDMLYSPEERIPICKLVIDESGQRYIEVKNTRTHRYERIEALTFVAIVLNFAFRMER